MAKRNKQPNFTLAELRSVTGSPELEAQRMAAVMQARQEIYEEAKVIVSGHITRERINSRTHVISKMGFGGNAGR